MNLFAENRLVLKLTWPILAIGTAISILLPAYLSPKLFDIISSRNNELLENAMRRAMSVCDERFNDLLELRMTSSREMRTASLNQAVEEIKGIHMDASDIHMLVVSREGRIVATTLAGVDVSVGQAPLERWQGGKIRRVSLGRQSFFTAYRYFPFWKIHIYGMISDDDYMAPIVLAKRIVYLGTFGVLLTVLVVLALVFALYVNRPLKSLIKATQSAHTDNPHRIAETRTDEIGKLYLAFNAMVDNLVEDKHRIHEIMRELRDSEEQYRILSEYSLTYIAMIQKGRLKFVNSTLAAALGLDGRDVTTLSFVDLLDAEDRLLIIERLTALESGTRKTDNFECRLKHRDGGVIWVDALATLALYRETHAVLFHAVNITRRKGLEKKLSQAQKMEVIGTLAGGVAQDLNNILSSLLGYPDLLLLDLPEESPLRPPLTQIQVSAQRAAEIVQDLLTLARRGVDVKQVLNLNQIVREYMASLEHSTIAESHPDIVFETQLGDVLLNMQGSSVHLTKCLMNLVRNAAESIVASGKVVIKTANHYLETCAQEIDAAPEGDYVVLTVEDNGTGISKEDIDRIFEPFYTKKVMGRSGTGLGMSVVLGTVQDHHGKVEVNSREGSGTRFTLYFPATREASAMETCAIPFEDYSGNGERILVVDDVKEQRQLMIEMLTRFGYSAVAVESGEAAVTYIKSRRADLLLLDMVMDPGMDGLDTLRKVLEIVPDQLAIILSGFSDTERVEAALNLGACDYLKKPVVMEQLGLAVRNALCLRAADRSGLTAARASRPEGVR
jgi:PAS domain S-box-containing protein